MLKQGRLYLVKAHSEGLDFHLNLAYCSFLITQSKKYVNILPLKRNKAKKLNTKKNARSSWGLNSGYAYKYTNRY